MGGLSLLVREWPQRLATNQFLQSHISALGGFTYASTVLQFTCAALRSLPDLTGQVSVCTCHQLPKVIYVLGSCFRMTNMLFKSLTQFLAIECLLWNLRDQHKFLWSLIQAIMLCHSPATSKLLISSWSSQRPHNGVCSESPGTTSHMPLLLLPTGLPGQTDSLGNKRQNNAFHIYTFTELIILKYFTKRCT